MARLVIKNTGATAVWLSDVTQSEGECPLSVHPVMRVQTLIAILHYNPSLLPSRGRKRQYISCLRIHINKTQNIRNIVSFILLIF